MDKTILDKKIEELKKVADEIEVVKKVDSYFEFAKNFRAKIDWQWYIYDQYYRGNHYVQWNKFTKTIETPPRASREVRTTINLVYTIIRTVKNFITRGRPLFEAMPLSDTPESLASSRTATKLLHSWWRNLRLLKVFKSAAKYGLKYGLAILETGWDSTLKKGEGDVFVRVNDPFDIYIDPQATCIDDARFVIKTIKKSIASIKENPNYGKNKEKIVGEEKQAASSYKEMSLQNLFRKPGIISENDEDLSSSILYECWLKSSKDGKTKFRVITVCEHQLLRDDDNNDLDEYPFTLYQVEDNPNEIYSEGWVKNIYPLNKIIDRLESQVVRYNNTMLKGKYIVDKNAGITNISTEEGEIIEKNPGTEVSHLSLKPLPNSINAQINNFYKYIELIGGSPAALQGSVPSGVRSGRGIEALQDGAANTIQDARENMEDVIADVGRKLIKIAAAKYEKTRVVKMTGLRSADFFKVIGNFKNAPEGVEKIEPLDELYVTLSSELAYTKDVQTERLIQLKQLGVVDDRTLLEHLPVGDVETVLDRLMEEKQQRAEMEESFAGSPVSSGIKKDKPNVLMGQPQVGNAMPNVPKP